MLGSVYAHMIQVHRVKARHHRRHQQATHPSLSCSSALLRLPSAAMKGVPFLAVLVNFPAHFRLWPSQGAEAEFDQQGESHIKLFPSIAISSSNRTSRSLRLRCEPLWSHISDYSLPDHVGSTVLMLPSSRMRPNF